MNFNIALLRGDGIGPEIVDSAVAVLHKIGEKYGHTFNCTPYLIGGCAIDATGIPLPKETIDGYLASDKGNNFQNISKDKFRLLKILNDNEKFYWVFYGLSKRKTDWVKKLLEIFAENKNLSALMQYFGKYQIAKQILFDTNPQKVRLYSSIRGAIEYWERNRLQNYEPNWE